jgi:hypothetical protein
MFRLLSLLIVSAAIAGSAVTASARIVTDNKDPDGHYLRFVVDQDMNQPGMSLSGPHGS